MSEIFKLLKESTKSTRPELSIHTPIPDEAQTSSAADLSQPVRVEDTLEAPRMPVYDKARFDLVQADVLIRSVLDPTTLAGEQFRLLRAKLSQLQRQRRIKSLLVTSSVPKEGKTFTAVSLAGVLAQEPGKNVLLIDADLRKPHADRDLGVNGTHLLGGLSEVLRGKKSVQEALLCAKGSGLYLLPAGPIPPDPAELLSSPLLEAAIRDSSLVFDWIVIDSPPVVGIADATVVAPHCDAVLLVVQTAKTPAAVVREAIQTVGRERICGIVMNRGKHLRSTHYYYDYYSKSNGNRRTG